jgi:AmiR/NasT family two-component response regulator
MNSNKFTQDEAFAVLRRASQHLNRKLREVAADVVDTGEVPGRAQQNRRG